jgi:hypothetical protein
MSFRVMIVFGMFSGCLKAPQGKNQSSQNLIMILVIGLAHNTVETWTFQEKPGGQVAASRLGVYKGATRCLTCCLDFCQPEESSISVAVGTTNKEI